MKIEMHTHTSDSSPCGHVPAARIPSLYQEAGYDGIVITDHYCQWAMEQSGTSTAEEYAQYFLQGYRNARKAAEGTGFRVYPGAEVNLPGSPNDFLLYGITEEFILQHPGIYELSLAELSALCRASQILLFQAHPYRTYCTPADPQFLDGAERFNGNPRHENRNPQAAAWTKQHHLLESSGSDFHELEDLAKGGIETTQDVPDIHALCKILRNGSFRLIMPGENADETFSLHRLS